jgi:1,4-dihydroxy-2-naphthoate octaprenyltransferase
LQIYRKYFDIPKFLVGPFWTILTTLGLFSNFANDYGDGVKGTDNE